MRQSIIQAAWIVQVGCLVAMALFAVSRPGFRALMKQLWKSTGFRWSCWVFIAATLVVLSSQLLRKMGIG